MFNDNGVEVSVDSPDTGWYLCVISKSLGFV